MLIKHPFIHSHKSSSSYRTKKDKSNDPTEEYRERKREEEKKWEEEEEKEEKKKKQKDEYEWEVREEEEGGKGGKYQGGGELGDAAASTLSFHATRADARRMHNGTWFGSDPASTHIDSHFYETMVSKTRIHSIQQYDTEHHLAEG